MERLIGFNLDPSLAGYTPERTKIFYQRLTDSLSSIPGAQSVGVASMRILQDDEWDSSMTVEGYNPARPDDHAEPYMNQIGANYFATLGVPIIAGRDFTPNDTREVKNGPQPEDWTPTTVMINQEFARRYFPGRNPIGRHLGFGTDPGTHTDMEIIGVVKDIKVHEPARRNPAAGLCSLLRQSLPGRHDGLSANHLRSQSVDAPGTNESAAA